MTPAILCIALAVYFEARGEPLIGQQAVAQVVLNRVWSWHGRRDACDVVFREHQFPWAKELASRKQKWPRGKAWKKSQSVALAAVRERYLDALDGMRREYANGATHFHATWVCPVWAVEFQFVGQIGGHYFYRAPTEHGPSGPAPCVPRGIDPN